ncbi:MAG: ATPase domain-containing protein [Candidatus Bathyarchaeia archaeon]
MNHSSLQTSSIPTGIVNLDRAMGGGLPINALTLIYGPASTGKTTLILQTSFQAALMGFKVIYIDADRSFSPERFSLIAGKNHKKVSPNILVFQPENFNDQTTIIENLEKYVTPSVALVAVDSVTTLYRASPSTFEGRLSLNKELTRQLAYLTDLAVTHNVAVVVSSQVHSRLDRNFMLIEPVAKRTLIHWSRNIIHLTDTGNSSVKEVRLERLLGQEVNIAFKVKLTLEGLIDFIS